MNNISASPSETVACALLHGDIASDKTTLKNAIRLGSNRLIVIGNESHLKPVLALFALNLEEVESYPAGTCVPEGANVVIFDSKTSD